MGTTESEKEVARKKLMLDDIKYCMHPMPKDSEFSTDVCSGTVNSNEALFISLVQPGETSPETIAEFHPDFTYPIFGTDQEIHGYRGLRIRVRFARHDLRPHLEVLSEMRHPALEDGDAGHVAQSFKEWISPGEDRSSLYNLVELTVKSQGAYTSLKTFEKLVQADQDDTAWNPPGQFLSSYQVQGKDFEIWYGSLTEPDVQQILQRIQFLVPCFIEGGTLLNLDDPEWTLQRWRVYFLCVISAWAYFSSYQ